MYQTNPSATRLPGARALIRTAAATAFLLWATAPTWAQNRAPIPPSAPPPGAQPRPKQPYAFNVPGMIYAEQIPTNFAIPAYTSNVVRKRFIATSKGPPSATVLIITKDPIAQVFDWYKNTCKQANWAFKTPNTEGAAKLSKSGTLYMIDGNKERDHVYVFCNPDKKTAGTAVTINWSRDKK